MKPNTSNSTPCYNKSGIYKLTCNTSKLAYVGQTSRNLKFRFQEHIRCIRNNNPQSAYAQHILYNQHEYGLIAHLMTIGSHLNSMAMLNPTNKILFNPFTNKDNSSPCKTPPRKTCYSNWPSTLPTHHLKKRVKQHLSYHTHTAMLTLSGPSILQH